MEHRLVVCAPSGVPTPLKQKSGHNVRLAHRQIARVPNSGEGGKKVSPKDLRAASQEPEYSNRSASFASVTLNPDFNFWVRVRCNPIPESASPARTAKKLLRKKKNESGANGSAASSPLETGGFEVQKSRSLFFLVSFLATSICDGQESSPTPAPESEPIVITGTRTDIPLDQSPASISVVTSQDFEEKQIERVADALREVPGLSVVQSGTAGQLTSVFMRGLRSEHTQVLLDGIPVSQGLQGAFNFADLVTDDIDRIEVVRGPQSTLYGPRALAGVIQIFTKQGEGTPTIMLNDEGGSYDTFLEWLESEGKIDQFDYSIGASRIDTDNARPNNQYRNSAAIANIGWSPNEQFRIGSLFTYSLSDTGNPNTIFDPKPLDNFLTERWLIAPHLHWRATDWWEHKFIFSYDHERQLNDPNQDGFLG